MLPEETILRSYRPLIKFLSQNILHKYNTMNQNIEMYNYTSSLTQFKNYYQRLSYTLKSNKMPWIEHYKTVNKFRVENMLQFRV